MTCWAWSTQFAIVANMARKQTTDDYFRNRLRLERRRRGLSQTDLANLLADKGVHIPATGIAKIEAGARSVKIHEASAIADVLETSTDSLFGRPYGVEDDVAYALKALRRLVGQTREKMLESMVALDAARDELDRYTFDGRDRLFEAYDELLRAMAPAATQALLVEWAAYDEAAVPEGTTVAADDTTAARWAQHEADDVEHVAKIEALAAEQGLSDDPRLLEQIAALRKAATYRSRQ